MKNSTFSSKWIFFILILNLIFNINVFSQPINGTFTVGVGKDYTSISAAFNDLETNGVDGPVVFNLTDTEYYDQVWISEIAGTSTTNTVTLQSENLDPDDVMIYYSENGSGDGNHVIRLNDCDHVIIQYVKIVNSNSSTTYTNVLYLNGTTEGIKIKNNKIIGRSGNYNDRYQAVIHIRNSITDNLEISNNELTAGSYPVYMDGYSYISSNVKIHNNICSSNRNLYFKKQNKIEITENIINSESYHGIQLDQCNDDIVISNNEITANYSSSHRGIYLNDCDGGIALQGVISNNVIYIDGDNGDANYGIYCNESVYQNFYHNTVYVSETNSSGYGFYANNGDDIVVKNNLLVVNNYGYVIGSNNGTNITDIDFNNYYTSGNYIAYWNGGNIEELSNLQSATSDDVGSKDYFPSFISGSDINGLIPQTHWLDGTGDDLTGIIDYDIDSIARPTSPDVGAYEFTAANSSTYSGPLTIQASSGTFTSFSEAADSLKKLGISGAVTISAEDNTYNENIYFPSIPGTSASNTITFTSASDDSTKVILQYSSSTSSDNYVVMFNGTDYVTFENLTLKNNGSAYARIFRLNGRAHDITITNNVLDGNGNPANSTNMTPITSNEDNTDNLTITNNIIKDGDRGIQLVGASTGDKSNGIVISNNEFTGYQYGIYLKWHTDFEISNNTFNDFTNTGTYIHECTSPYKIESNKYSSTAVTERGIYIDACNGSGDGGLIYNNFIHVENSADIRGIWIWNSFYQSFYNNSINVISSNGGSRGLQYDGSSGDGSNMIFKNNNIVVQGPGYPLYIENADATVSESDYNNLYTTGSYIARWNPLSYDANGYDYTDIATLTAASGKDANSQNYNPSYFTDSDLHINSYWLDGAGVQIESGLVTDDIDGEARSNPPDIGADEYTSTILPYDGEYTIGTSGRFATFNIAIDSLIERGILDTVIFKVQTDYYTEQFVIPQIAGTSDDAVIIFESESGNAADVTVTFNPTSGNNYLVKFNGADYITFRNMSFQSGTDQYARIIAFSSKCENNNFTGNIFSGRSESSTGENDAIIHTNGGIVNNLTVTNNTFSNGSAGIWMQNSSSSTGTNLEITDNTFSCYNQGIYITWFVAPQIENNHIIFSRNDGMGINIQQCSSGATFGMSVQNNQIYSDTYAYDAGAMYFNNCDANPSFPGLIANNVIRVGVDGTRSMGLDVHDSDYLNFYHNSVNITGNQTNDHAFVSYTSNYINIVNNNFVIKGDVEDKTSSLGWPIYIASGTIGTCDYNNYYTAGKYIGYWLGTNYGTLAELQTGNNKDVHSVNYFPGFRGTNNLKMRSSWLDNKGTALASVTTDVNDSTRNETTPDIGAYEYTSTITPIAEGTYTVSSLGGDYPSLDSLTRALMERGIAGPVTFELLPGSYPNTNITIKDIPGVSASDTVVIQSQSGDPSNTIISHTQESSHNYILRFTGTDYLTIKDLTFNSGGSTYSRILRFEGNSQNVKILDNVLNGLTSTSVTTNQASICVLENQIIDSLLIKGNTFVDNSYGVYYGGFDGYSYNEIKVVGNTFNNQYRNIYFKNTKKPYIEGNEIVAGIQEGIYLDYCDNDLKVLNNKIFVSDDSYYAIYLLYCDGSAANKGLIANNFIGVHGVGGTHGSFGIKLDYTNYQNVYYNSVEITGSKGSAFHLWNCGNIQVANNVFVNSGTTTYSYNISQESSISVSDYNDFYSTGTNYIHYNGTDYATLSEYKTASLFDNNSLNVNPVFTSSSDFHLLADSVVGKAVVLADVATDIDGETRDASTPDIGADEFSCAFYPSPIVEDVTACSNDSIPSLYAEGTNIKWYSDLALTTEIWSANEYNPAISTAGVYTYYVTQTAMECTSLADSVVLTIFAAPALSADITHIDCQGTDYGTINLTVGGSTASPFSYLWSNDEIYEDIDNLDAGDYIVTVEDLNRCIEIDTFRITAPEPIILEIITEDTECDTSFGSATVVASGGETPYDYRWNTGDSVTVIEDLYAGIYIVTVTDNRGCSEVGIATVSDIGAPTITLGSITDVSCYGGSSGAISLTVSGDATPYTYEWSNGATTEDISSIEAGPYEIIVDDANGCQAIESFIVDEPDPIKISLNITETSCGQSNGATEAIITGGTSPYIYSWSTGSADEEISGLNLGAYNIDVTDNNGCTAKKYFSISEIGAPSVIVDSIFEGTCGNSNGAIYISAYGAYTSYTYSWSSGVSTEDLIGVNPGTYNVTVSDEGGCDAVQVATIEADKPEVNPICMVTVDTATNYNEIVWEKQYTDGVNYYKVYKESTQSDVYYEVGTVNITNESVFVDEFSDVMQRSWRYKVAVVDVCGIESDLSEHHKTMHLTINLGINNSINLIWDHYEGFDYETYYIHRRSDSGWELLDSVPNNLTSYTDANPVFDEDLYYMIEIKHPYGCDPSKASRNSSRSNISRKVKATADTEPPTAPASLTTTEITDTTISLIWQSSTDNVGVTAYEVYKDDALLEEVGDTTYKATGLTKSTTYSFYVKAKDAADNISEASNTINPTTTGSTSIDIFTDKSIKHIKLYPNPNKGELIINIETIEKQEIWFEIYTVNGIMINNGYLGFIQGKYENTIDISEQGDGMYFIKIFSKSGIQVERIILSK